MRQAMDSRLPLLPSFLVPLMLSISILAAPAQATDQGWPQFRADGARTGYTADPVEADLHLQWIHRPVHAPRPAWVGPDTRMPFDYAHFAVLGDGRVYFGSSVDGRIYALDIETGRTLWAFPTEGPVRFAPLFHGGKVFAVSDDGHLYALCAETGALIWKRRGGPADERILGNGRMISRWPVRGAPALVDGRLYDCSGIWPSEGILLRARDPDTGEVIWMNDTAGYIAMAQPHGGAFAQSGVSCQGYLSVAGDDLLMPTGRAVPAGFDRATGAFRYFHLQGYSQRPVSPFIALVDGITFNKRDIFRSEDGRIVSAGIGATALAAFPDLVVHATGQEIRALPRPGFIVENEVLDRKGNKTTRIEPAEPVWNVTCPYALDEVLIGAGRSIFAAALKGRVLGLDRDARVLRLDVAVDGRVLCLAAAEGRLVACTDRGTLYGFGPEPVDRTRIVMPPVRPPQRVADTVETAAQRILAETGITEGFALDLGCGDGSLARELARRTDLHVIAVTDDPAQAARARATLAECAFLGDRVTVIEAPLNRTGLPDYFADLVVSSRALAVGADAVPEAERSRLLRPCGGRLFLVRCDAGESEKLGGIVQETRGPLPGAGEWTHQYADPANTNCSADTRVKGPLGMLWFTDNDLFMPSRHGRGPAPLYRDGRLFVEGLDGLRCLNAYNGRVLWNYPLPEILKPYDQEHLNGAAITGSNFCLGGDRVFVRWEGRCLVLDGATGKVRAEHPAPADPDGAPGTWGYIAYEDGILFGTLFDRSHVVRHAYIKSDMSELFSESTLLFAMDPKSGKILWSRKPEHSIRNNSIALSAGRLAYIDRPKAPGDRGGNEKPPHPSGALIVLNARTGKRIWTENNEVFGTMLAVSQPHDLLIMAYQPTRFRLPSEKGGRMAAFDLKTGKRIWDEAADYASRIILNGDRIYAQPGAWDLRTGKKLDFAFSRSYGCGILVGSPNLLAFRSATLGYRDLSNDHGTENYGGIRPGCWINILPVGGMLLMPEASNRCVCSYLIKATVALKQHGLRAPAIEPPGGAYPSPVMVRLTGPTKDCEIRYTLNGTPPVATSPRYEGPIPVKGKVRVKARALTKTGAPSMVSEAFFLADASVLPLNDPAWAVHDPPGGNPPKSKWVVEQGVAKELSNLFQGSASNPDPGMDRPGSFRIFEKKKNLGDGVYHLELSTSDDDVFGVTFRWKGPERYYLFAMDRQRGFHVLARKDGKDYRVLASNKKRYDSGHWYDLEVKLDGPRIEVWLDGEKDLEAEDPTAAGGWTRGAVGLHAWGCAGAQFRFVRWISTQ